ncbi:hypothetical protein Hte_007267 [Hypoxylon texense]
MARFFALALALATAVHGSSISEYWHVPTDNQGCTGATNVYLTGSTPTYCNTQQGASIGYTLDKACPLVFYSDINCANAVKTVGSASKGCQNFPGTGGSWKFSC